MTRALFTKIEVCAHLARSGQRTSEKSDHVVVSLAYLGSRAQRPARSGQRDLEKSDHVSRAACFRNLSSSTSASKKSDHVLQRALEKIESRSRAARLEKIKLKLATVLHLHSAAAALCVAGATAYDRMIPIPRRRGRSTFLYGKVNLQTTQGHTSEVKTVPK